MDGPCFDRWTRALASWPRSRRGLLGALVAGTLGGLLSPDDAAAACRPPCRRPTTCCGRQCVNKATDPNNCGRCGKRCGPNETCQRGRCVHHCEDGEKNFGESDEDCGRVCDGVLRDSPFGRCRLRKRCEGARDCRSGRCEEVQPGAGKICIECLIDRHCDSFAEGRPRCIDRFCYECAADFDCPAAGDPPERRFCVADPVCPNNQPCICGGCRRDTDCPEGAFCDDLRAVCTGTECDSDADCPVTICGAVPCRNGLCVYPDHCSDGQAEGAETDLDCGICCRPCANGRNCEQHSDCQSRLCKFVVDVGDFRCSRCQTAADCPAGSVTCEGGRCV